MFAGMPFVLTGRSSKDKASVVYPLAVDHANVSIKLCDVHHSVNSRGTGILIQKRGHFPF